MTDKIIPWSRRKIFLEAPPDTLFRVRTVQHFVAWQEAIRRGYLTGSHGFGSPDEFFDKAYEYMRGQMALRMENFTGDLPVWCRFDRVSTRKPYPWGMNTMVRISAMVPKSRMLISDYDLFHCVLNDTPTDSRWYDDDENETWSEEEKIASWNNIFDLKPRPLDSSLGQPSHLQACVDRIYINEIYDIKLFKKKRMKPLDK